MMKTVAMVGGLVFLSMSAGCGGVGTNGRSASAFDVSTSRGPSAGNSDSGNSGDASKSDSGNSDSGDSNSGDSSDSKGDGSALLILGVSSAVTAAGVAGSVVSTVMRNKKKARRRQVEQFVTENLDAFRSDAARGSGETIDAITKIAECPRRKELGPKFQGAYGSLFMSDTDGATAVTPRVIRYLRELDCSV